MSRLRESVTINNKGKPTKLRIIIADDHPLVRAGVAKMLAGQDIDVVAQASNGAEAVELARELLPDVILMDIRMPEMNGVAATRAIKAERPETAVLMFTGLEEDPKLNRAAIEAGAAGCVPKVASRGLLTRAVHLAYEGIAMVTPDMLNSLVKRAAAPVTVSEPASPLASLSPREQEVLTYLAEGYTNKEIALQMNYSVGTVKNAVQRIIEKLGASDRTQAAVIAARAQRAPSGEPQMPEFNLHSPPSPAARRTSAAS